MGTGEKRTRSSIPQFNLTGTATDPQPGEVPSTRRRSLLRGVDLDDHKTPAEHRTTRSLRGAGNQPSAHADPPTRSLDSSDADDEDLDHEDDGPSEPRYSRRNRTLVERYTPGRPVAPLTRHRRGAPHSHALGDLIEDSDAAAHIAQPGERFTQRYSARERRTVDRFNPLAYKGPGGSGGSGRSHDAARPHKRVRHAGYDDAGHDTDGSLSDEDLEEEEEALEDDGVPRKTYEFRDRSLVTIDRSAQQPQQAPRPAPHERFDRRRMRRGGRREGRRSRDYGPYDELPDLPVVHGAGYVGVTGQLPGGTEPWAAALGAAGLAPAGLGAASGAPHNSAAIAGGGGGGGSGGLGAASGAANLEITPVEVDPSVTFEQVGGLEHYVRALKEMVFLPLVYPELFERFQVSPPRGVLFYGPPGTGKTLVARALAAHASRATGGRKISFFMRKGADVLSKWVGESERHLRLLFEEARRRQPSIIFFDEIDGLAPVRSSRSDQIHNSIVSTLLALMDGLDKRGQVVVIGATNRVDAVDGALRRPGRFDRELLFPLPSQSARAEILGIHTRSWQDPPPPALLEELSSTTVGYCGADLKALVTEASLAALRRRYPQIYNSEQKLLVDPQEVRVERRDFISALRNITPASHRAAASPARPLPGLVAPVLLPHLQAVLAQVHSIFPPAAACMRRGGPGGGASGPSAGIAWPGGAAFAVQRPRLLICGPPGSGQGHLGPALLYALEGLPAHTIGLPSLLTDPGARSPEEALVHAVAEARRAAPAVLYLPHLETWWATAPASLQATLWTLLADVPPDLPLLLLGTANVPTSHLHREVLELFGRGEGQYDLPAPTHDQRMQFFKPLAVLLAAPPAEDDEADEAPPPPQLPVAPEAHAQEEAARAEAARAAARRRYEDDQAALRTLRMILRSVVSKQLQNRKWEAFWEPVHPEDDPEYWQAVAHPMDLTTLLDRIDRRRYTTPAQFLADVALIPEGERQFWGKDPSAEGLRAISKASQLEDDTRAMVEAAVRLELTQKLESIVARGGPAPAPEGLYEEMGLAADGTLAQPARPERGSGAVADGTGAARRTARLAGEDVDRHLLHRDPEAERRRLKAQKRELEAQQAEAADAEERALVETAGRGVQEDAGNAEEGSRGVLAASTRGNLPDAGIAPLPKPAAELSSGRPGHEGSAGGEEGGGEEQEGGAVLVQGGMYAAAPERELSAEEAAQAEKVQRVLTDRTMPLRLAGLEDVHACAARGAWECRTHRDRSAAIAGVLRAVEEYVRRISAR